MSREHQLFATIKFKPKIIENLSPYMGFHSAKRKLSNEMKQLLFQNESQPVLVLLGLDFQQIIDIVSA